MTTHQTGHTCKARGTTGTVGEQSPARVIWLDRRTFLRLSVASGLATVLGCSKDPEPGSPASPDDIPSSTIAEHVAAVDPVGEQASALGKDLSRIFSFVRDDVRYEPYSGVLRGAGGTIAGLAGNSADQAVLLAALLKASDIRCRFAIGALDSARVTALEEAGTADFESARGQLISAAAADARRIAAGGSRSVSTAGTDKNPDRHAIPISVIRETATRQFQNSIDTIESALARAGARIGLSWSGMPRYERERHVWVQAETDSGWIDLDPCFVDSELGGTSASVNEVLDALPDDMRHRVEFNVIAESWAEGGLQQARIFEHTSFADELMGAPICFTHVKADALSGLNLLSASAQGTRYHPVLELNTRVLVGDTPVKFGDLSGSGGGTGGTLVDALGGGGPDGPPDGETVAEWLEVRILSPDEDPKSAARTIFDRAWEHRRADGTLEAGSVSPVELIDLPTTTHEFLPCRTVHAFSVAGGSVSIAALTTGTGASQLAPLAWPAHAYHQVRESLAGEIALSRGVRVFVDSPCIVSLTVESIAGATELHTVASFDIWHRRFGVLPIKGQKAAHSPLMVAGILSHIAERCVSLDGYLAKDSTRGLERGVGSIFEQAVEHGIPVRVLRSGLPTASSYSREAQFLLDRQLRLGATVVIPERIADDGSPVGWWLVDPDNGWTIDCMDDGRGGALVEYISNNLATALKVTSCLIAMTSLLATIYQYAANKLTKVSDLQNEILSWIQIVTSVVGVVSGAGCFSSRWVPRPRPPSRLPPDYWYGTNPNRIPRRFGGLGP